MKEIEIIEYRPELAAAVAEMWNKSADGWGGGGAIVTAEYVAQQEETSDNINLYLAMEGDLVVGYCGLSEYREDLGSLYIPLLNVRGDYQGKKIGKKLLLKALERSVQLGWPRLDLYTWPGNTKAVPLYKKCGFFWEERDETTHLMNFIPTVLNNDVVKDFFKELDWYKDSQRVIEVKPDGRRENGFDYYEYLWEKNDSRLKMEFERMGRGLRLIETDDYLISATVEDAELVFGKEYRVFYDIVNKSGKPLEIILTGEKDKNIEFDFVEKVVTNNIVEKRIEGKFKVGEIEEEQIILRTHPSVTTKLLINGKETCFKVGILPKFPVKIAANSSNPTCFIGVSSNFYLNIENNFKERVDVSIHFPDVSFIELQQQYTATLEGQEKKSIAIPYSLKDFGFYNEGLDIEVKLSNGNVVSFKKKIGIPFKGFGAKFAGEGELFWHIYNGAYEAGLNKFRNSIFLGRDHLEGDPTRIMTPKLGKPYTSEFDKKSPDAVEFYEEKGAMVMKTTYNSNRLHQLQLIIYVKLFAEGLIEQILEVKNLADTITNHDIWINHPVFQNLYRSVLPYDDGIIEIQDSLGSDYSDWESSRITENWIFSQEEKKPRGICWSPKYQVHFSNWFMFFEYSLGKIPAGESIKTEPLYISLGAYQDWESFRGFALKGNHSTDKRIKSHLEFTLNQYNPIVQDKCTVTLRSNRSEYFNGDLEINLLEEEGPHLKKFFKADEEIKEVHLDIQTNKERSIDVVSLQGNVFTQEKRLNALLLQQGQGEVRCEKGEEAGMSIYSVDNGEIQIKAAPEFFPSLFSMVYREEEWMHNSFPTPTAKSWWNPWGGGSGYYMEGINYNSIKKETTLAEFVTLKDHLQNEWRGIKLETKLEKHIDYKGLQWNQYFLMLPGIPVVCSVVEILQDTGKYLHQTNWEYTGFFKLANSEHKGWIKSFNDGDTATTYVTGKGSVDIKEHTSLICGKEGKDDMLQVVSNLRASSMMLYMNKEVSLVASTCKLDLEAGKRVFTTPIFHLFTDKVIPEDALTDLRNIRFE